MGEPLRLSGTLLIGAAVLAAIIAQMPFLDFEAGSKGTISNHEQVWGAEIATPEPGVVIAENGTTPTAWHSYYDSRFDQARGIGVVRFAGPVLGFGVFVLLAALVLIQGRQTLPGGLVGVLGSFTMGTAVLLLVIGFGDMNRDPGDTALFPLRFALGFYILVAAAVLALAGSLLSIADPSGRDRSSELGPAGGRPVLSAETPDAFDPMRNRDPIPFKPDPPREFREFKVDPPKTFKAKGGPPPGGEGSLEPNAGADATGATGDPAATPAKATKPAAKPNKAGKA